MSDCIFCKLANGEIPTKTFFENEDFRVIFDAAPASKGHALILPKKHYANLFEMPDELAAKLLPFAKEMAASLMEKTGADGMNLVQNNGEAAGQTVFHFHLHLIPRYKGDDKSIANWKPGSQDEAFLDSLID